MFKMQRRFDMARIKDRYTLDMFEVANPVLMAGDMDYRSTVSAMVSKMLSTSGLNRHDIAVEMSRLEGVHVSKYMLDAWSSEAREDFNIPFYQVLVLETVCDSNTLTDWHVEKRGGKVAYGKSVLEGELGKLEVLKQDVAKQIKEIKKVLGDDHEITL